jgi:hypothetical protein
MLHHQGWLLLSEEVQRTLSLQDLHSHRMLRTILKSTITTSNSNSSSNSKFSVHSPPCQRLKHRQLKLKLRLSWGHKLRQSYKLKLALENRLKHWLKPRQRSRQQRQQNRSVLRLERRNRPKQLPKSRLQGFRLKPTPKLRLKDKKKNELTKIRWRKLKRSSDKRRQNLWD